MERRRDFSDSDDVSSCCLANAMESPLSPSPDFAELSRLSDALELIFFDTSRDFDFFADARIVTASGREIPVHRCILSARSPFFKNLFLSRERINAKLELKEVMKEHDVGDDALVTVLAYIYSGKFRVSHKDVCVCVDEECTHLGCRPAVAFMVDVLYTSFVFQINKLVDSFQKLLIGILHKATADDVLMVLSVANICGTVCESLSLRSIEIIVKSDVDTITLDKALPHQLVRQINESRVKLGLQSPESFKFPDKHVKRIHRALDSDDVELVMMLLKEEQTSLDDAYALHYAVAYCNPKTTTDLLDLAIADINLRNLRGYTVLHVAAMRKEPNIIASLLTKGARPTDLTSDGRKAIQISKSLTRAIDYNKSTEEGKATPKDRLCIEILEQAERRDPLLGEASVSLAMAGDDLRAKLLYLENRVALAKLIFPMEAKVAIDIAQVDGISEFQFNGIHKNKAGVRRTAMDLNEAPFKIQEEHLTRLRALSKTVELGRRFFPRCSSVLNKIMDGDDYRDIAQMGNGFVEDSPLKRQRRMELEQVLSKAFTEDKEEFDRSVNLSSSSSSSSMGVLTPNAKLLFR
ncbi:hypothetical protein RD792_014570 [Penstemon davidsonii]|uniref:Uncharacterized protein n=1 Tax=Penstemon davidsonii TaxID=160366 RepID=A0ABR0CPN2_9LAMI|nr:hypothetical protein RD792_014570 [Penstemon davidsonii]